MAGFGGRFHVVGLPRHCKEGPIGGVKPAEVAQKQQKIEIKKV